MADLKQLVMAKLKAWGAEVNPEWKMSSTSKLFILIITLYIVIKECDLILHLKLTAVAIIQMVSCYKHWTQSTSQAATYMQEKGLLSSKGKKIPTKGRSRDNIDPGTEAQALVSQTI